MSSSDDEYEDPRQIRRLFEKNMEDMRVNAPHLYALFNGDDDGVKQPAYVPIPGKPPREDRLKILHFGNQASAFTVRVHLVKTPKAIRLFLTYQPPDDIPFLPDPPQSTKTSNADNRFAVTKHGITLPWNGFQRKLLETIPDLKALDEPVVWDHKTELQCYEYTGACSMDELLDYVAAAGHQIAPETAPETMPEISLETNPQLNLKSAPEKPREKSSLDIDLRDWVDKQTRAESKDSKREL